MKRIIKDIQVQKNIYTLTISGLLILIGVEAVSRFDLVKDAFNTLTKALAPFIWGIVFAFFLCKFADYVESVLPEKMTFKRKRSISSFLSILLLLLILAAIIMLIVPQLASSVSSLSTAIIKFINSPPNWIYEFEERLNLSSEISAKINDSFTDIISGVWNVAQTAIPNIVTSAISTFNSLLNFIIGFIVCLYVLNDREHLLNMCHKFFRAVLPDKGFARCSKVYDLMISKIYLFFQGKTLDSLIVGIICFIFMVAFKYEYSLLISVIIGITNIIPFFGPFIGAVPCTLILLISNPLHALVFIIFVVVLQQLDGNVIGPKIIGDSVGLSSLWIMFSILIGSAYFGVLGMILGVPVFSVVYILVKDWVNERLVEKDLE